MMHLRIMFYTYWMDYANIKEQIDVHSLLILMDNTKTQSWRKK